MLTNSELIRLQKLFRKKKNIFTLPFYFKKKHLVLIRKKKNSSKKILSRNKNISFL